MKKIRNAAIRLILIILVIFLNFGFDVPISSADTYVIDSWTNTGEAGTTGKAYTGYITIWAQSFTGDGGTLATAKFYLARIGSPTGSVYAKIYSHTGTFGTSSKPGSLLATSDAVDITTISTSVGWVTFTFSGANQITLTDDTNYIAGVNYSGGDASNCLSTRADLSPSAPPTGHAGNLSDYVSAWWAQTWELPFSVNGVAGSLTVDIVDGSGVSVGSPSVTMNAATYSFINQTVTGTLGAASQKIRVNNTTATATWTMAIAGSATTAVWTDGSHTYDFNDSTASAGDGADDDSVGGQLTINPSSGTITPQDGCNSTGISLGSSDSFVEDDINSITLASAGGTASTNCYWDFTGISLSQTVPASQNVSTYTISLTITVS